MVFNILNTTNYGMMQNQMAAGLWNAAAQNCSFWSVMTPSCFPTIMLDPRFLLQRNSIFPAFGNQSNNQSWQNWIIPSNNQTQGGNPWDGYWEAWNKNNKKVETDDSEDVAKEGTVTKETRVENLTTLLKEIQKETDVADEAIKTALEEAEKAPTPEEKLNALNKVFDNVSIKFDDIKNCLDQKDIDLLVEAGLASNKSEKEIDEQINKIKKKVKEISDSNFNTGTITGLVRDNKIDIFDLVAKYPDIITAINAQKAKIIDPEDQVSCNETIKVICDNLIKRAKAIDETGLKDEITALENALTGEKYDKIQEVFDKLYVAARLKAEEKVITHLKAKYSNEIANDKTFDVANKLSEVDRYKTAVDEYNEKKKKEVKDTPPAAETPAAEAAAAQTNNNGKEKTVIYPRYGESRAEVVSNLLVGYTYPTDARDASNCIKEINCDHIFYFLRKYNELNPKEGIFTQLATEWGFDTDLNGAYTKEQCMKHLAECMIGFLEGYEKLFEQDKKGELLERVKKELKIDIDLLNKAKMKPLSYASALDNIAKKYIQKLGEFTIYVKK